jgi:hypothetical protein
MVDPAHYHVRERRADKETGRVIGYRTRFHRAVGDALVDAGGALGEYVEVDPHPFVQKDTYIMSVGADAWAGLEPQDRAERIAHDIRRNIPGTTMRTSPHDDVVEFVRGGRTLATVPRDVLCGDDPLELHGEFIPEVPDTPAELDNDDQ